MIFQTHLYNSISTRNIGWNQAKFEGCMNTLRYLILLNYMLFPVIFYPILAEKLRYISTWMKTSQTNLKIYILFAFTRWHIAKYSRSALSTKLILFLKTVPTLLKQGCKT